MLMKVANLIQETKNIIFDARKKASVEVKGYGNYVTQVDYAVQNFLKENLRRLYPEIQFMGEEGDREVIDFDGLVWILDPIDGTCNLVRGLNQSAVSLGLVKNRVPILGVVYNPFAEELFYAEAGQGSYLNGVRISVSDAPTLHESLISLGTAPYNKELGRETFETAYEIYGRCEDLRRFGAAAIELCNLAAGRTDGFFERNLKPWDYAGGAAILKEAGGIITNYKGGAISFEKPDDIVASNGKIQNELLEIVGK
ncbi:MAG: inositol monophosphatase [Clostridia bacterium]|nr:inositol monophosphatase [Clostridia bacterium]